MEGAQWYNLSESHLQQLAQPKLTYRIEYSPDAEEHLRSLTATQQVTVLHHVERRLTRQPTVETSNRKPMRPNPLAPWESRIGNLRDVEGDPERVVYIRAVGIKHRNRVRVGREVIEL